MVTLIIVDYNTIAETINYLTEFWQKLQEKELLHVVIVDNSEKEARQQEILDKLTGYRLTETDNKVKNKKVYLGKLQNREYLYVAAEENLGYAKGNNLGAAVSKLYYPEDSYYLFSNNDLILPEKFSLRTLIAPIRENGDVAVVGPKIVGRDGEAQTPWKKTGPGRQLFLQYLDLMLPKFCKISKYITNLDILKTDVSRYVYWVSGAFFLVDAKAFQQVNGFDERTFLYCEEMILAERLLRIQKRMYYENQLMIVHEHGQTVKKAWKVLQGITFSFESSLYYYREYRGLSGFTEKMARANFSLFRLLFAFKKKLKGDS